MITLCTVRTLILVFSLAYMVFSQDPEGQAFDLEKMPAYPLVIPVAIDTARKAFGQGASEVTLLLQMVAYINMAWFDALAPYHPTATGKLMLINWSVGQNASVIFLSKQAFTPKLKSGRKKSGH